MGTETVDHPQHYQTAAGIEAIDVMERYGLGPHLFVAMKHLLRAGKKGDLVTDLRKADWYIERALGYGGALYIDAEEWAGWRIDNPRWRICAAFGIDIESNHGMAVDCLLLLNPSNPAINARQRVADAQSFLADAISDLIGTDGDAT